MDINIDRANYKKKLLSKGYSLVEINQQLLNCERFCEYIFVSKGTALSLAEMKMGQILEYGRYLLDDLHMPEKKVNQNFASLKNLFEWAQETNLIEINPIQKISVRPNSSGGIRILNHVEQEDLQKAIERDIQVASLRYPKRYLARIRDASIVIFISNTGLRLSEVLNIRMDDVFLREEGGEIMIRQKRGRKERKIPLNSTAKSAIIDWLLVRPEYGNDFLWIAVERERENAGLFDLTPQILRDTFGKNLIDSGVQLNDVAELMGYSNLNTTKKYIFKMRKFQ
ncbi:MAG: tyrosine-type recombinase/integrase [Anaerolineaceae bacterium]|nr:tyrosine-type recombinase/integrase [Anaerolineaceae bacterium]